MALIKCEECGHMVSDRATECPNCGCPIEKKGVEEKIVCEECGAKIPASATVCPECGCPVEKQHTSEEIKPQEGSKPITYSSPIKRNENKTSEETNDKTTWMIAGFLIFVFVIIVVCATTCESGSTSSYSSSTYTPEESKSEEIKEVETVEESKPEKIRKVKTVEEARSLINNTTWHYTANTSRSSIGFWVKVEFKNGHYTNYYASPADGRWTQDGEGLYEIKEGRFSNTGQKYISVSWKGGGGAGSIRGWHYEYELLLNHDFQFVAYAIGNDDKDYGYMEFGDYEWD